MTTELDVSSAQSVQATTPPTNEPELDLSTAQPVQSSAQPITDSKPVELDLSTAQPVKGPKPVELDLSTAQPVQTALDTEFAKKLWQDIAPKGSLVNRILTGEKLPDGTWNKVKAIANMPLITGATDAASALPVLLSDTAEYELRKSNHPTLAKIAGAYAGEKRGESELEAGMSTPLNLGIMAATGGLGTVEGAASSVATRLGMSPEAIAMAAKYGPQVARLVNAGFAINGIYSAYKSLPEVKKAFDDGNTQEVARLVTQNAGTLAMSGMAGVHALGDVLPEGVQTREQAKAEGGKTTAEPTKSLPNAPAVKIVDSEAQKVAHLDSAEAEAAKSVEAAKPGDVTAKKIVEAPLRVFHGTSGDITDVTEMKPEEFGKPGTLGVGAYFTVEPRVAGNYAGPENIPTGGRVIAGDIKPGTKILDADAPLPERLQTTLKDKFGEGTTYRDYLKTADPVELQKAVSEEGYRGVKSEDVHGAPGLMLFPESSTGVPLKDILTPTLPTAKVVPENYVPAISRDEVLAEATQRVVNNSPILQQILDPAKIKNAADIDTALDAARQHIERGNDPRVNVRIGFEQIKNLARDLNLKPEELLSSPSGEAANAETVTAARMLLQRSSESVLDLAKTATADPTNDNAKADLAAAIAKHAEIADKVRSYAAEAGRALVSHRISTDVPANKIADALSRVPKEVLDQAVRIAGGLDETDPNYEKKANQVLKIADALESTKPETLDLAARLLSKIDPTEPGYISKTNKLIAEITPSTTSDKLFEIYRNFLLSSPSTPIKKTASEGMMALLETATKGLRGGIEQGKAKLEGRTPDALASDGFWFAKGAVRALANAGAVIRGEFDVADAPGFEDSFARANKGIAGSIIRTPAETLSRLTNVVYMTNYYGELESLAARQAKLEGLTGEAFAARQEYLASNPTKEMIRAANETGLHGTFQQELGKTGGAVQAAIKSNSIAKFLFPFVKTPINLVKSTLEYSLYGAVKGTLHGDLTAQTRGLVGSSLAAGVAYLAAQGLVTGGGPVDFRQREAKESTGWQPYSIKIGGKYYRYNRAEPLGLLFSSIADTVHGALKDEDPAITGAKAQSALDHIGRNVEDLPFLMQLSGIINSLTHIGTGHTAERIVDNLLASAVVPAGIKAIAQASDTTMRSPERNGLLTDPAKGLLQTIEERVPGLTKNVPADIDITGQPVKRPVSALGGANPFPVTEDKKNFALNELARLGVVVGSAPQTINLHRNGVPVTFTATPDEAREIQKQEITQFWQTMQRIISQPGWGQMPDFQKKIVIDSIHKRVTENRVGRLFQLRQSEGLPRPTPTPPNVQPNS